MSDFPAPGDDRTSVAVQPSGLSVPSEPDTSDWAAYDTYRTERYEALEAACHFTIAEMDRYYRDGSHPDLSVISKAAKKALEVPE